MQIRLIIDCALFTQFNSFCLVAKKALLLGRSIKTQVVAQTTLSFQVNVKSQFNLMSQAFITILRGG